MKQKILFAFIIVLFLYSCEDQIPTERNFPIIETMEVSNIDKSGATFNGHLIKKGKTTTTSYGFVWDVNEPNINDSHKVIVGENINSSSFKVRIDSTLIGGLEYYVRTFATYNDKTVYGNMIRFLCKGSNKSAWSLPVPRVRINGYFEAHGCSDNELGYIVFQSSDVYSFNPESNEILKETNFPHDGNSATRFTSVTNNNVIYVFSNLDRKLYKYQSRAWIKITDVYTPYFDHNYYHGLAYSNNIFILGRRVAHAYSLEANVWLYKAKIPRGRAIGGTNMDNKSYVITSDKNIWQYNPENNDWKIKTTYPGILYDDIVSFSFNGKLYFGLSYSGSGDFDKNLWIYDSLLNLWSKAQEFPADMYSPILFSFSLNGKLYFGDGFKNFRIWEFDPTVD